jgi:hypothetical protein
MKYSIQIILPTALLLFAACSTKDLTGIYECQSLKGAGVGVQDRMIEALSSDTCAYTQLEFKADSTIVITGNNRSFTSTYTRNKDEIRVKDAQNDILFTIRADRTLKGEGVSEGIYKKY